MTDLAKAEASDMTVAVFILSTAVGALFIGIALLVDVKKRGGRSLNDFRVPMGFPERPEEENKLIAGITGYFFTVGGIVGAVLGVTEHIL